MRAWWRTRRAAVRRTGSDCEPPVAGPPFLPRSLRLYLGRRQQNRSSRRPIPWVGIGYSAVAILVGMALIEALFGPGDNTDETSPPATFEALLDYESDYLPARSAKAPAAQCTSLPATLVRAYRLEFLARRGATVPERWQRYFNQKDWYEPQSAPGDTLDGLSPKDRSEYDALAECAERRGL